MSNEQPEEHVEEFKEQDRYLPIANVARIMKRALPENAKIAKDAKECVQECVSEFISFITSEYPFHIFFFLKFYNTFFFFELILKFKRNQFNSNI